MRGTPLPITASEGGDRLYIHPYSVPEIDTNWRRPELKIRFIGSGECRVMVPDSDSLYKQFYFEHWDLLSRLWHLHIRRAWHIVSRLLCPTVNTRIFGFWWELKHSLRVLWCMMVVQSITGVVAASVYDDTLPVTCGICIDDPEGLVEDTTLQPSQKWLRVKVDQWLADFTPEGCDEDRLKYLHEEQAAFLAWRTDQLEHGRNIYYACSIDT